jgi:hypothetical protein
MLAGSDDSGEHAEVAVGEFACGSDLVGLVRVDKALNLGDVQFLVFFYDVAGQVEGVDALDAELQVVGQRLY